MLIFGRFKPSLWPTVAAIAMIMLTLWLGTWQLNKGIAKRALQKRFDTLASDAPIRVPGELVDAKTYLFRKIEAHGRFEPKYEIFLDNKIRRGIVGYEVITPLKIDASNLYVLVNRGWVAAGPKRAELPVVKTDLMPKVILGIGMEPTDKFLELSNRTVEGKVWENLVLDRYRRFAPFAIQPFIIQQNNNTDDGLVREWTRPDFRIEKHYGYAFQWFSMALAIAIIYIVLNFKRAQNS